MTTVIVVGVLVFGVLVAWKLMRKSSTNEFEQVENTTTVTDRHEPIVVEEKSADVPHDEVKKHAATNAADEKPAVSLDEDPVEEATVLSQPVEEATVPSQPEALAPAVEPEEDIEELFGLVSSLSESDVEEEEDIADSELIFEE